MLYNILIFFICCLILIKIIVESHKIPSNYELSVTKTKTKNLEFSVHLFLEEFWSNPGQISQEFCGHTVLEEIYSHLNCYIIRLANRILIETNENFHNNSTVIYFLKNSNQSQDKFPKNSVVIQFLKNSIVIWITVL